MMVQHCFTDARLLNGVSARHRSRLTLYNGRDSRFGGSPKIHICTSARSLLRNSRREHRPARTPRYFDVNIKGRTVRDTHSISPNALFCSLHSREASPSATTFIHLFLPVTTSRLNAPFYTIHFRINRSHDRHHFLHYCLQYLCTFLRSASSQRSCSRHCCTRHVHHVWWRWLNIRRLAVSIAVAELG